jgi:general secretion pathway protein A
MPDAFEDSPQQAEAASATEERRGAARGTPAEAQAENQAENPADGAELAGIEATQPPVLTGDVGVPEEPMPRISLARLAPPLPEVAVAELPALMLEDDASIPALLQVWGYEADAADCAALPARGLECERTQARWSDLRRFDRPAALRLMLDGEARYALVTALDDEFAILQRGERRARVPIADLDERWSGDLLMLWRLPPSGTTLIGPGSAGESVLWLREQLAALPDAVLSDLNSPRYDAGLRAAVRAFQVARGLQDDGIAGPRTLMLLNNALSDRAVPRLSQSQMDKP